MEPEKSIIDHFNEIPQTDTKILSERTPFELRELGDEEF